VSGKRINPDPADVDWGAQTIQATGELAPTMVSDGVELTAGPASVPGSVEQATGPEMAERYQLEGRLGKGGMADVHLFRDRRIGRDVALKTLRKGDAQSRDRFIREVRVQGQLEHPAVVPVYDLGMHGDGRPFFTMRRLRGATVREILRGLRNGNPEIAKEHSQRRLLTGFADVCLAVHYAHEHGVVHRDLKPENIMLGDFGEVYVLDWGIARVSGDDGDRLTPGAVTLEDDLAVTQAGSVFGTPGYMAPEQVTGETAGPATDVYALGAILFELLTHASVNTGASLDEILKQTRDGVNARISERFPELEIAPELEAICLKALATEPGQRFASVRELHDQLDSYLAGDRDLAKRRELADKHAKRAEAALDDPGNLEARAVAMREAGRALALDPRHAGAAGIVTHLLLDPPPVEPPEVEEAVAATQFESSRRMTKLAVFAYLAIAALVPVAFWAGVRNWPAAIVTCVLIALATGVTARDAQKESEGVALLRLALFINGVLVGFLAYLFGPFLVVPAIAAFCSAAFLLHYHLRPRWMVPVVNIAAVFVPLLLEWMGIVAPSYRFENGSMVILPRLIDFAELPMLIILNAASLVVISISAFFVAQIRSYQLEAERRLHLQAWHMRQVLPDHDTTAEER